MRAADGMGWPSLRQEKLRVIGGRAPNIGDHFGQLLKYCPAPCPVFAAQGARPTCPHATRPEHGSHGSLGL